jgi:beta-glucosidase
MVGEGFLTTLKKSVQEGKVNIKQIDLAVKRILEAKYDLGLFEDPYKYCDANRTKNEVYSQVNRDIARNIAAQSMVLMKNTNEILPLKSQKNIAVIGPLADNAENMPGTWSVAAKHKDAISVLTGLKKTFGNSVNFTYAKGSNIDYDATFEQNAAMFGKNTYRDSRSKEEMLKEAVIKETDSSKGRNDWY